MNSEKELKTINEYIALWEKYYFELGDKEKGKEYLNKAMALKDELWENNKKEIVRVIEKSGSFDDGLLKEILTEDELLEYYGKSICNRTEEMDLLLDFCKNTD